MQALSGARMFQGAIPPTLRRIVRETVLGWGVDELAVGCSGNLTIERSLATSGLRVAGNDVNIYSCAIGEALAGHDMPITVKDRWRDAFGWLDPYLDTPYDRAATIILASDMLDGPVAGLADPRPYFASKRAGYRLQWERLHERSVAKLKALPTLTDWYSGDVAEWLEVIGDRPFASFPPFWAGGYETMFAHLSEVFEWAEPTYPILDASRIDGLLAKMADRPHWILGLLEPHDALADHYTARTTTVEEVAIHVYTSEGPARVVVPRTPAIGVRLPTLTTGDRLTGELSLRPLTTPQFEGLRRRFLATGIARTATAEAAWAVCDAGRIIGAFGVQEDVQRNGVSVGIRMHGATHRPLLFLLSDFAVAPHDYPKLSKLVAMAALSVETHVLAERIKRHRFRGLATTAFTDRPVSMKYRGVFDLVQRIDNDSKTSTAKYKLNYAAPFPRWTLAEAFAVWSERWGATT